MIRERSEHCLLKRLLPLRRVTSRGEEAERQNARDVYRPERGEHERLVHSGLTHVAKVTEQGKRSQLLLAEQTLPSLALVGAGGESDFPRIGRREASPHELLPDPPLRPAAPLGVRKKEDVAQLDGSAAIVLPQLVL